MIKGEIWNQIQLQWIKSTNTDTGTVCSCSMHNINFFWWLEWKVCLETQDKTFTQPTNPERGTPRSSANDSYNWSQVCFSNHQSVNCPIGRLYNSSFKILIFQIWRKVKENMFLWSFSFIFHFYDKKWKSEQVAELYFPVGMWE